MFPRYGTIFDLRGCVCIAVVDTLLVIHITFRGIGTTGYIATFSIGNLTIDWKFSKWCKDLIIHW